jgi:prepilin peptidase CpaA
LSTSSDVIVLITVVAGCAAAAVIDLRSRRVPNALTLSMAAAGILIAASGIGRLSVAASLAGCLLGLILMLPGHLFGATGAGDVKLFAAAGTLLGPAAMVPAFIVTAIAGGVLALCVAASRGRVTRTCHAMARLIASRGDSAPEIESMESNNRFAYAPAVAIGVTLAAIGW